MYLSILPTAQNIIFFTVLAIERIKNYLNLMFYCYYFYYYNNHASVFFHTPVALLNKKCSKKNLTKKFSVKTNIF